MILEDLAFLDPLMGNGAVASGASVGLTKMTVRGARRPHRLP